VEAVEFLMYNLAVHSPRLFRFMKLAPHHQLHKISTTPPTLQNSLLTRRGKEHGRSSRCTQIC